MDFNFQSVDFRHVDIRYIDAGDQTFKISTHSQGPALAPSIEHIGLINPPICLVRNRSFVIVAGFARIQACIEMGWSQVPVRCLPATTPFSDCVLIAIADNCSLRELDIVEKARAARLLAQAFDSPTARLNAAQAIGFSISPALEKKLHGIHEMGEQLQFGLIEETIGLPVALKIHAMLAAADAAALAALLRELNISLTRQREMTDWIETIMHRDGLTIHEILSDPEIIRWRSNDQMDGPQKSQLIREYLKKRCYPAISNFEQHYSQAIKAVGFEKGVYFTPPPHFEGRTFSLRVEFANRAELVQRTETIRRLIQSSALSKLLNPNFKAG